MPRKPKKNPIWRTIAFLKKEASSKCKANGHDLHPWNGSEHTEATTCKRCSDWAIVSVHPNREGDIIGPAVTRKCSVPAYSSLVNSAWNANPRKRGARKSHLYSKRSIRAPRWDDCDVHVWEERDRLHIELRNRKNGKTVAEWWDDDARQMFEDGFFESRNLENSVKQYANEMGWIQ